MLISICIPCRNEVENILPLIKEICNYLDQFHQYDYEIIFIDNCSDDGTSNLLREICSYNKKIKAILNIANFRYTSSWYAILQASGDCIISIPADFQVPLELLPKMIIEWEKGAKVVALLKKPTTHDKYRLLRKLYYFLSKNLSGNTTLSGFTGAGLYDKNFISICKSLNDPVFSLQFMVLKYAFPLVKLFYNEQPRRAGKSKFTFSSMIDTAIIRYVRASSIAPHYAIVSGIILGLISFIISIYYLIRKILNWQNFPIGIAPLIFGMFFLGSVQLIFLGIIGEYILLINERQQNKPLVTEKERINFDD